MTPRETAEAAGMTSMEVAAWTPQSVRHLHHEPVNPRAAFKKVNLSGDKVSHLDKWRIVLLGGWQYPYFEIVPPLMWPPKSTTQIVAIANDAEGAKAALNWALFGEDA